jgi:hypothetical protein
MITVRLKLYFGKASLIQQSSIDKVDIEPGINEGIQHHQRGHHHTFLGQDITIMMSYSAVI